VAGGGPNGDADGGGAGDAIGAFWAAAGSDPMMPATSAKLSADALARLRSMAVLPLLAANTARISARIKDVTNSAIRGQNARRHRAATLALISQQR